MAEDNIVFIGGKHYMSYVLAVTTQFNDKKAESVIVRARGRFITRAVDVVELVKRKFFKELKTTDVKLGSEVFKDKDRETHVSTIEIVLEL